MSLCFQTNITEDTVRRGLSYTLPYGGEEGVGKKGGGGARGYRRKATTENRPVILFYCPDQSINSQTNCVRHQNKLAILGSVHDK